jgi:hypothetical protein
MDEQGAVQETAVEARQGDRRKMNMRVLFWGLPAAIVLVGAVMVIWM